VAEVVEAYAAEPASHVTDLTLDDVLAADAWARKAASRIDVLPRHR